MYNYDNSPLGNDHQGQDNILIVLVLIEISINIEMIFKTRCIQFSLLVYYKWNKPRNDVVSNNTFYYFQKTMMFT